MTAFRPSLLRAVLLPIACLAAGSYCLCQCSGGAHLQRSLDLTLDGGWLNQPIQQPPTPSLWLSLMGGAARNGVFLAGLEIRGNNLQGPVLRRPHFSETVSLRATLAALLSRMPGYECRIVKPGLVNIRPIGAANDLTDPLNHRVASYSWTNLDLLDLIEHPQDEFSFLRPPPFRGVPYTVIGGIRGSGGRVPNGSLRNTTLLGILNQAVAMTARAKLANARLRRLRAPSILWSWYCVQGRVDPRTGLRATLWSALEMAPRVVTPPRPPVPTQ